MVPLKCWKWPRLHRRHRSIQATSPRRHAALCAGPLQRKAMDLQRSGSFPIAVMINTSAAQPIKTFPHCHIGISQWNFTLDYSLFFYLLKFVDFLFQFDTTTINVFGDCIFIFSHKSLTMNHWQGGGLNANEALAKLKLIESCVEYSSVETL